MSRSSWPDDFALPRSLDEIDAAYMTKVLRHSGAIAATNEVVSQEEQGVGMTAGYFSSIKKVRCTYRLPTDAPTAFVAKAWPALEIAPKESIAAMFIKDIKGYQITAGKFYPRPKTHLAAFDEAAGRYALIMEDASVYAEHKVHERELSFDEVMRLIPGLVDVALAWEGADAGAKAEELAACGVRLWASPENIGALKAGMPGGAALLDLICGMAHSSLVSGPIWRERIGVSDFCPHAHHPPGWVLRQGASRERRHLHARAR